MDVHVPESTVDPTGVTKQQRSGPLGLPGVRGQGGGESGGIDERPGRGEG